MARKKSLEDRAERIIQAAEKLFGHYGFEKTTLDEIAREAGISKASIYLEFSNKEEVLMAVIRDFMTERIAAMQIEITDSLDDPLATLRGLIIAHLLAVYEQATTKAHSQSVMVQTSYRVKSEMLDLHLRFHELIAALLERAAGTGQILPQADYLSLATCLGRALSACCPPYPPGTRPEYIQALAEHLLDVHLSGLKHLQPHVPPILTQSPLSPLMAN
jgi:AcrR family transcriptional regulator